MKANMRVRKAMFEHNLAQWQLAKILGCSEQSIWRKLRDELPDDEQTRIIQAIERSVK